MQFRAASCLATVLAMTCSLSAEDDLVKRTYDISEVVRKRSRRPNREKRPVAEQVVNEVLRYLVSFKPLLKKHFFGERAMHQIRVLNRKRLEVLTDKTIHGVIKGYLEAQARLLDLAVVVECSLFEVDRKTFEKVLLKQLPRLPGEPSVFVDPATEKTEEKLRDQTLNWRALLKNFKPTRTSRVKLENRESGTVFSLRRAIPYTGMIGLATAYEGFTVSVVPRVSRDRRSTYLTVTQKVAQLHGWTAKKYIKSITLRKVEEAIVQLPLIRQSSFTSVCEVLDGLPMAIHVPWLRPNVKDKVLVLALAPQIWIEEEQRELKNKNP